MKTKFKSLLVWDEIELMYNCVICKTTIECSMCHTVDEILDDGIDATEKFYNKGWRIDEEEEITCPKCTKKRKFKTNISIIH